MLSLSTAKDAKVKSGSEFFFFFFLIYQDLVSDLLLKNHVCFSFFSSFCQSYDMKQHSTKVFRDIVNALGSFIQSLFIVPNAGNTAAISAPAGQFTDFKTYRIFIFEL